jgi:hypothetical protein
MEAGERPFCKQAKHGEVPRASLERWRAASRFPLSEPMEAVMDPKHNRDQNRPKQQNQESQHNKSNAGHQQQPGQREGHQTEQKKRSGMSS